MLNPILRSRRALVVALVLLLLPSVAYAQAAITGVVPTQRNLWRALPTAVNTPANAENTIAIN